MANMDTVSKRFSIMNISCPWRVLLPKPDGTVDAGDRIHFLHYYSGIGAAAPTTGSGIGGRFLYYRRRRR